MGSSRGGGRWEGELGERKSALAANLQQCTCFVPRFLWELRCSTPPRGPPICNQPKLCKILIVGLRYPTEFITDIKSGPCPYPRPALRRRTGAPPRANGMRNGVRRGQGGRRVHGHPRRIALPACSRDGRLARYLCRQCLWKNLPVLTRQLLVSRPTSLAVPSFPFLSEFRGVQVLGLALG